MNLAENLNKLPKWAQSEVGILQRKLEEKSKELERIQTNPVSNTIMGSPYTFGDTQVKYLPPNQNVCFVVEKGYIEARIKDGELRIMSQGEGILHIKPEVSNVITLTLI